MNYAIDPKNIELIEVTDEAWFLTLKCGFVYSPEFVIGPDQGVLWCSGETVECIHSPCECMKEIVPYDDPG